jgi:hypothetical protein
VVPDSTDSTDGTDSGQMALVDDRGRTGYGAASLGFDNADFGYSATVPLKL